MTTILLILVILMEAFLIWMQAFSKQKGENAADIDDNREKYYEAEKGKNLATKEDIERYRLRLCEADMKQLVGLPQQSNYYGERCRF